MKKREDTAPECSNASESSVTTAVLLALSVCLSHTSGEGGWCLHLRFRPEIGSPLVIEWFLR